MSAGDLICLTLEKCVCVGLYLNFANDSISNVILTLAFEARIRVADSGKMTEAGKNEKLVLPRCKEQHSMSAAPSGKIAGKKHPGKAILAGK